MSSTDPDEGWSLPTCTCTAPESFQAEMQRVMRPPRQIVCHVSEVPVAGANHTLDCTSE
jgi:hypothetical protein